MSGTCAPPIEGAGVSVIGFTLLIGVPEGALAACASCSGINAVGASGKPLKSRREN